MIQSIFMLCGGVFRCIYTRAEAFLCIFMNIGAFLQNISPKGRKTLDFSAYVCYADIVKENGGAVANKNTKKNNRICRKDYLL